MPSNIDSQREIVRHTIAAIVYRGAKTLRDAPLDFEKFRVLPQSQTPVEIIADIGDRMQEEGPYRYRYQIRKQQDAFWPLMLSNLLQVKCILQFGKFFAVESIITPLIRDTMV